MAINDPVPGGEEAKKSPMQNDKSMLAVEEGTGKTKQLLTDAFNNLFVKIRNIFRIIWTDDVSFNKGAFVDTEILGVGNSAGVQLEGFVDSDDDIAYVIPGSYTLSDGAKIEVGSGQARLKSLSGVDNDWPFIVPSNYTISDITKLQVLGGSALLRVENIVGHWHLNESSGSNVTDSSGNGNDGATVNMEDGDWVAAKLNNGLLFDGVDEYVNLGDIADFERTDSFSLEFWFRTTTSGAEMMLSRMRNSGTFRGWNIFIESGQIITALISDNATSNRLQLKTNGTFNDGAFHHCIVTYDGSSDIAGLNILIDENDVATTTVTNNLSATIRNTVNCQISGRDGANVVFGGTIDEVVIYTYELTGAVMAARYNSGAGTEILSGTYFNDDPSILVNSGFAFTNPLSSFNETAIKPVNTEIQYQCSSDNGTIFKWWNGSTWVARTIISVVTAVNTLVGTVDAGNLASLQTLDANTYDVSEVASNPGFTVNMDMSNVGTPPDNVIIHGYYTGTHTNVNVDIWDFNLSAWVTLGQLATSGGVVVEQSFPVTGVKADKLQNEIVQIRINHDEMGNASHDLILDWVYVDGNPTTNWWNDNEANTASVVNSNIGTLASSGTLKFEAFLDSSDGLATPELDHINVAEPSIFSTDDNLYIDTKDISEIAPTVLIAWLAILFSGSQPANTDRRILFSIDGRVNWLTWSGSAWVAPTSPTTRTDATSLGDAVTNFPSLGIGDLTLNVRLFLKTDIVTSTPVVSNINVLGDAGFKVSGTWESNVYDSAQLNTDWDTVTFNYILSGGTAVLKARAANDLVELATTSYGPSLADGDDAGVLGQFIQFKLELANGGGSTPFVDEIAVQHVTPTILDIGA